MDIIKKDLFSAIRDIPNFPIEGVLFKDITTLLQDGNLFSKTIDLWANEIKKSFPKTNKLVALESRGFIFASALAVKLNSGLILVRKKGKLPYKTHQINYGLEYGQDTFEIHTDALNKSDHALIIDDVLATGGSANAAIQLLKKFESNIEGLSFLMKIDALKGEELLEPYKVHSFFI